MNFTRKPSNCSQGMWMRLLLNRCLLQCCSLVCAISIAGTVFAQPPVSLGPEVLPPPTNAAETVSPPAANSLLEGIPQESPTAKDVVAEIRIEGNSSVPESRILGVMNTRAGRPYDTDLIQADVRKLYQLGWFSRVEPNQQMTPKGRVIIFRVVERPSIRYINFLGVTKFKQEKLEKEIGITRGEMVNPHRVQDGIQKIKELYQSKGYNRVQVNIIEGKSISDNGVVYEIHEGPQQRIVSIKFTGVEFVSESRLKTQIQSGSAWGSRIGLPMVGGIYDPKKVQMDERGIEEYYKAFGFYKSNVSHYAEYDDSGEKVKIRFAISEGPQYHIRQIAFAGNSSFDEQAMRENLVLQPGMAYERTKLLKDQTYLQDLYGSQGKVFADIKPEIQFLENQPGQMDLVYKIDEGKRFRVGQIFVHVSGPNPHTKLNTIWNRLSLKPGDIMDSREIRASERRLAAAGLWNTDPTRGSPPKISYRIPELDTKSLTESAPPSTVRGQGPSGARHQTNRVPYSDEPQLDIHVFGDDEAYETWLAEEQAKKKAPTPYDDLLPKKDSPQHSVPTAPVRVKAFKPVVDANGNGEWQSNQASSAQPRAQSAYANLLNEAPQRPAANPQTNPWQQPAVQPRYQHQPTAQPQSNATYTDYYGQPIEVRGQSPGGASPTNSSNPGYGGYGVGRTGPDSIPTTSSNATSGDARLAQYQTSPNLYPNTPLSPSAPPTMPQDGGSILSPNPNIAPYPGFGGFYDTDVVDIYVDSTETETGRFMAGASVNSDLGVFGNFVIDERHFDITRVPTSWQDFSNGTAFRGGGQRFRLEAAPGNQVQRYLVSISEPYLFNTPYSMSVSGSFYDRRYVDWDEQRVGGRLALGYQWLDRDLAATLAYRGEKVNIRNPASPTPQQLTEVLGNNELHGFRGALTNDTRDSAFLATSGHFVQFSFEQVIGSFDYPRAEMDFKQYFLLHERPDHSGRHTLGFSSNLGYSGTQTPIYEHFFAGGYSTLRGFDFRGASPIDGIVRVGGEFQWINSLEYLFPISADDMIRGVLFCDFGTVEPKVALNDLRISPGFGLRITVPAMGPAPIAIDFAWPVAHEATDDLRVFSFNVGLNR